MIIRPKVNLFFFRNIGMKLNNEVAYNKRGNGIQDGN